MAGIVHIAVPRKALDGYIAAKLLAGYDTVLGYTNKAHQPALLQQIVFESDETQP
jgi:hypothetical protein